jgi:hypothetical protein
MEKGKRMSQRKFPIGCKIVNIRPGAGARAAFVYAHLVDEKNNLLMSATLEYINDALKSAKMISQKEFEEAYDRQYLTGE